MTSSKTCFQISSQDNVAVVLEDVAANEVVAVVGDTGQTVTASEAIQYGHKMAMREIPPDDPVIKYGICIGYAIRPILPGEWVHLHNCASGYDERSSNFDPHTGATHDTAYQ